MKERSDLICGKAAVGGNYNSTHDNMIWYLERAKQKEYSWAKKLADVREDEKAGRKRP